MSATMQEPKIIGGDAYVTPDDRDAELLCQRATELDADPGPRCGDFVRFADGRMERVSHVWDAAVQTSEGGSFYLGHGYVSFSGGLNPSIPAAELRRADEAQDGSCWFFHHDRFTAHNAVHATMPFRVYDVSGVRERVKRRGREWWSDYVPNVSVAPLRDLDAPVGAVA